MSSSDAPHAPPPTPPGDLPPGNPDADSRARTHLANERTFLAWFRTGLTLMALGIAAAQFLSHEVVAGVSVVNVLATILVVTGVVLAGIGAWRYVSGRERIDDAAFRPAHWSVVFTTAAAIGAGVLAILFVWLLRS